MNRFGSKWSDRPTSEGEFSHSPLKVSDSMFEHGAVTRIVAFLKLPNDTLKREAEVLFFAQSISLFPCQARLLRRGFSGCFVLLCLDGLALPAASHWPIIPLRQRPFFQCQPALAGSSCAWGSPILGRIYYENLGSQEKRLGSSDI